MKISWNNGYWRDPRIQVIEITEAPCRGHVARGDTGARKVAVIDGSDGEYEPVLLCHECLVDLANELL